VAVRFGALSIDQPTFHVPKSSPPTWTREKRYESGTISTSPTASLATGMTIWGRHNAGSDGVASCVENHFAGAMSSLVAKAALGLASVMRKMG
jgi:hypothetical protein